MENEKIHNSQEEKSDIQKAEKQIEAKDEFNYEFGEIKIISTANIDEPFKSKLKQNIFFKNDDAIAVLQVLKAYDNFVKNKSLNEHKFPNKSISLELKNGDNIDTLNVKLGEGNFDTLKKLINSSKTDLTKENKINELNYSNLLQKKVDLNNIFDGGVKSLEVTAEALADETLKEFIQGFSATMNALHQKQQKKDDKQQNNETKEKINKLIDNNFEEEKKELKTTNAKIMKENKITNIKEKDKDKIKHKTTLSK